MKTDSTDGTRPDSTVVEHFATLVEPIRSELERRWRGDVDSLDSMCRYALVPPGKLLRPALVVVSALAVGGEIEQVLPVAIGTEYGHTASLVHDDIIDSDKWRRGRPSTHHKFGTGNAIVVGDSLIFHLFLCLTESHRSGASAERVVAALEIAATAGIDLCRGQTIEAEITEKRSHEIDRYLHMVELKSAALFKSACQCGAVLGGGSEEWTEKLGVYGIHLGIAFQIIDDLFAYVSDTNVIGKEVTSDIRNRRLTLPVLLAYRNGNAADRSVLDRVFSGEGDPAKALDEAIGVLTRTGALETSRDIASQHIGLAKEALSALPATASRDRLGLFADYVINRAA